MNLNEYIESYQSDVVHWAHVKTRVKIKLDDFLLQLKRYNVQILYANTEELEKDTSFRYLCELLENKTIWAVNLGEVRFSEKQCSQLTETVKNSNICFMFVDAILVGKEVVRRLKDIIRERRRKTEYAPWIFSNDEHQNFVISQCKNMWFGPSSLGRNKTKNIKKNQMDSSWKSHLSDILTSEWFTNLENKIKCLREEKTIYPKEEDTYKALSLPFEDVKVVILGQDPYHGPNQAHGLSFSVPSGVQPPPSLVNIFKEAKVSKTNGDLTKWMNQGVLLLNSVLTVEASKPRSHHNFGWEKFTNAILEKLVEEKSHIVFLLWGRDAQNIGKNLKFKDTHLVLRSSHPSPLGAHYHAPIPFTNCQHFEKTNDYLEQNNMKEIDWSM